MENNILQTPSGKCSGCSACAVVCPTEAISMQRNKDGFYEPILNEKLCIHCGKCLSACPVEKVSANQRLSSYYGYHTDAAILQKSTSGGAFRALADEILKKNGIVYGAKYSDDYAEVVFSDSDACDVTNFQKSKYILSNPGKIYKDVKEHLDAGRYVLFSGAPCQVAGLTCFLNKKYDNLLTVDFVCGGMPSLAFWQEHKKSLEKKYNSQIKSIDFRSKRNGWGKCYLEIHFENGEQYFTREYLDSYYHCFCDEHISVRNSCLNCEFHDKHFSDITIADFWGYAKAGVTDVSKGCSLLLANNRRAEDVVREIKGFCAMPLESRYSDYAVTKSSPTVDELKKQKAFFELAEKFGFEKAARKMCPATWAAHIKKYVKLKLGRK